MVRTVGYEARLVEPVGMTHIDYDVVMSKRAATPVRFDPPVADRLASFVAANPGMSLSSATNRLVDEALRMAEHPGVIFRSGPTGRRAALAGGPDVWEVIRAIKSAHAAEPGLHDDDLLSLVSPVFSPGCGGWTARLT